MKIIISYTVLVALAIAHALPIDNGEVNPGLDAAPKYSPLIGRDSAASPEARARMPWNAGSRPPPRVDMVVANKAVKDVPNITGPSALY